MSDLIEEYYERGLALSKAGKFAEAISEWREAVTSHPDWADQHDPAYLQEHLGYLLMAQAFSDQGDLRPAREAFEAALKIRPASAYALRNLGEIQWRQGEKRRAVETLKAAIAAEPTNSRGYMKLARAQMRLVQWRACLRTIGAKDAMLYAEGREDEVDEAVRQGLRYIAAVLIIVAGVGLLWRLVARKHFPSA